MRLWRMFKGGAEEYAWDGRRVNNSIRSDY